MPTAPTNWRARYRKMFNCDTARIPKVMGMMFLIIGEKRNTRDDPGGRWYKNDKPFDFAYVQERVIASGKTHAELLRSARTYKQLCAGRLPFQGRIVK